MLVDLNIVIPANVITPALCLNRKIVLLIPLSYPYQENLRSKHLFMWKQVHLPSANGWYKQSSKAMAPLAGINSHLKPWKLLSFTQNQMNNSTMKDKNI